MSEEKKTTDGENDSKYPKWLRNIVILVMTAVLLPIVAEVVSELIIRRMDATPEPEAVVQEVTETPSATEEIVEENLPPIAEITETPIPVASTIPANTPIPVSESATPVPDTATPTTGAAISLNTFTVSAGTYNLDSRMIVIDSPYRVDELEVTRDDFAVFLRETTTVFDNEAAVRLGGIIQADNDFPMVSIKADEAQIYCESRNGRLPTPEEWLIAYGIQATEGAVDLSIGIPLQANLGARSPQLREGGLYPANRIGLHDMVGNAAEWALTDDGDTYSMGGNILSEVASSITDLTREVEDVDDFNILFQGFRCIYDA